MTELHVCAVIYGEEEEEVQRKVFAPSLQSRNLCVTPDERHTFLVQVSFTLQPPTLSVIQQRHNPNQFSSSTVRAIQL